MEKQNTTNYLSPIQGLLSMSYQSAMDNIIDNTCPGPYQVIILTSSGSQEICNDVANLQDVAYISTEFWATFGDIISSEIIAICQTTGVICYQEKCL